MDKPLKGKAGQAFEKLKKPDESDGTTYNSDYKEVDTTSFLAQSEQASAKEASLLDHENKLIENYGRLMSEKHDLMTEKERLNQHIYKLEEDMAYCHRRIQRYQRVRIEAANAGGASSPKLAKGLQNETGLSPKEIDKGLKLMYGNKEKISDN